MMRIQQDIELMNRDNEPVLKLVQALSQFHKTTAFATGIDWGLQVYWAELTDEQLMLFALKHPEYKERFRKVETKWQDPAQE